MDIDYYALDLSRPELKRTLSAVDGLYKHVHCHGLFGTYDDGLAWMKKTAGRPKCILWMGSSIGNLDRTEAADFLQDFSGALKGQDSMLIGIDACQESDKVYQAYNDKRGVTHEFILNGLMHANKLIGKEVFRKEDVSHFSNQTSCFSSFCGGPRPFQPSGTCLPTLEAP